MAGGGWGGGKEGETELSLGGGRQKEGVRKYGNGREKDGKRGTRKTEKRID